MLSFPKHKRILSSPEFRVTMDAGYKTVRHELVVFCRNRTSGNNGRLGLIVSKKVGNSVTRNRVKRQLREIFRSKWQFALNETISSPVDTVIIAREAASRASYQQLESSWLATLPRVKAQWDKRAIEAKANASSSKEGAVHAL